MNLCVVYTNCQGAGVVHFLRKAGFPFQIEVYENYKLILKELSPDNLKASAKKCCLFIVQPISEEKHGELSSAHYTDEVIPKSAFVVRMPSIFNHGQHPLIPFGHSWLGLDEIRDTLKRYSLHEILGAYDQGLFNFHLTERFNACLEDQRMREKKNGCNVLMSDFMDSHRNQRLMLTFNHPTSLVLSEMARQVQEITIHKGSPLPFNGENDANLPCTGPVSQYVTKEYGWTRAFDPGANEYYRNLLKLAHAEVNK